MYTLKQDSSDVWIEKNKFNFCWIMILIVGIIVVSLGYLFYTNSKNQSSKKLLHVSIPTVVSPAVGSYSSMGFDQFLPGKIYHTDFAGYLQAVNTGKPFVVMFHANWCGPCKATLPHFEEAASKHKSLPFVAVESNYLNDEVKSKLGIKGFPTIRIVKGNTSMDYKGNRTVDDFLKIAFY